MGLQGMVTGLLGASLPSLLPLLGAPLPPGPGQLRGVVPMLCPWVTPELARKEVPGRGCLWAEVWKCPWGKDVALLAFVSPWAGGSRPPGFMCS